MAIPGKPVSLEYVAPESYTGPVPQKYTVVGEPAGGGGPVEIADVVGQSPNPELLPGNNLTEILETLISVLEISAIAENELQQRVDALSMRVDSLEKATP